MSELPIASFTCMAPVVLVGFLALVGCGKSGELAVDSGTPDSPPTSDSADTATDTATDTTGPDDTASGDDTSTPPDTGTSGGDTGAPADDRCAPLPPPSGPTLRVTPADVGDLQALMAGLEEGTTVLFADGTYALNGVYLWVDTPGVTLRGESGDADAVILDGGYVTTEIITVAAADVTITDLTLSRAWTHGVHATGGAGGDVTGVRLHRIAVMDPGEQGVKINSTSDGAYTDDGVLSCSHIELTDAGRPEVRGCYTGGVDAHKTRGWVVRDNHIEGFWCESGLSEHGIHFWRENADVVIERNTIINCARGIGLGLTDQPGDDVRAHPDISCPNAGHVDDYRGTVRNNMVFADDERLFDSGPGFDTGVSLGAACEATVVHNTVYSTRAPFSSIEWRFEATSGLVGNNLVSHNLMERTADTVTASGNQDGAGGAEFMDASAGDLRLAAGSGGLDAGAALGSAAPADDWEAEPRSDGAPDVGADERH